MQNMYKHKDGCIKMRAIWQQSKQKDESKHRNETKKAESYNCNAGALDSRYTTKPTANTHKRVGNNPTWRGK